MEFKFNENFDQDEIKNFITDVLNKFANNKDLEIIVNNAYNKEDVVEETIYWGMNLVKQYVTGECD